MHPVDAAPGPQEHHDADQRHVAAHIEWQKQGAWVVFWGVYTRRFWAFACWPVPPEGGVVSAATVGELYAVMRNEERKYGFLRWRHGRR